MNPSLTTTAPSSTAARSDPLADALRVSASLADLMNTRVRPALEDGAVVVSDGFMDELIVHFRVLGLDEDRLSRVADWAVGGLKPDLTVLVDAARAPQPQVAADDSAADDPAEDDRAGDGRAGDDPAGDDSAGNVRVGGADAVATDPGEARTAPAAAPVDVAGPVAGTDEDDDERVDLVQAYRDRASYTPERYLIVRPLSEDHGVINAEVAERIASVLRERSPATVEQEKVA